MATEIIGLSHREREIVANIVRYNHLEFDYSMENSEGIDREEYLTIVKLTAILQIANALDRSHKQKCRDIKAVRKDDKLILTITTNEDITLERRSLFGSRAEFFREVYSIAAGDPAETDFCKTVPAHASDRSGKYRSKEQ